MLSQRKSQSVWQTSYPKNDCSGPRLNTLPLQQQQQQQQQKQQQTAAITTWAAASRKKKAALA